MIPFKQIKVTDKIGNKLAVFDNSEVYKSHETMRNTLAEPILHIESGKIATLDFKILSDCEKWKQVNHPENLWYCEGRVFTMLEENSVSYDGNLANVTLYEIANLLKREYAQIQNMDTKIEPVDIHTIKILPRSKQEFKLTINGVKYEDSVVKDSRGITMPRGSAGYALWALLKASKQGWKLGICDVLPKDFNASKDIGSMQLESDQESIFENIQHIPELWGGVLVYDSLNKFIHLRDESIANSDFNTWNGFTAREGINLLEKPQIQVDNNIITKAYILGNGDLSIKQVNDDKEYLENYSYTNEVYEGYLRNENIHYTGSNSTSGQSQLKLWGTKELAKMCRPRKVYLFSVLDRSIEDDFSHMTFAINDIAKIYFTDAETGKTISDTQRIIDIQYDVFSRAECSVIAGDKILNKQDIYKLIYDNSAGSVTVPDWSGGFNASDIVINIPDEWINWFGGSGGYSSISTDQLFEIYVEKITENTNANAGLRLYADETFSTIETFTNFEKKTEDEFSKSWTLINQTSSALEAQITLEAGHYKETKNSIVESNARITATANTLQSQITLEASHYKETKDEIETANVNIVKSNAKITETANSLQAQISLEAKHYKETKDGIANANANIAIASNNLSASINAEANYRSQGDKANSDALASFKAYASSNYATVGMLASTNNNLASVSATANGAYSEVRAVASRTSDINAGNSFLTLNSNYSFLGYGSGSNIASLDCRSGGEVTLAATNQITIGSIGGSVRINYGNLYLNGRRLYFANGYVRYYT